MLAYRQHMSRPFRLIVAVVAIYAFCWVKDWPRYYDDEELPPSKRPPPQTSVGPHRVDHDQLVVSVTTTANDVYSKLAPLILNTPVEDHGSLLLFSDLQTEIGSWPVFDVIWRFASGFVAETRELRRYRDQVDYARGSRPIYKLQKGDAEEEKKELATLDKYKILQSMAAAWEYRPDRSWYAFVGDETYVHRPHLLDWLSQYDAGAKHFFGNPPTQGVPAVFAAGGNSFILSRQVMKELFTDRKDLIKKWEKQIESRTSAFELVFGVLKVELKLDMVAAWPGISGFDPSTAPFSPTLWCEPVLMMHHVTPDMGSDLFKLEKERADNHLTDTPLRFADLWTRFMTPENLNDTRTDWDNLSSESSNARWNILFEGDPPDSERAKKREASPEACQEACVNTAYCMQWSYSSIPQKNWNDNPPTKCHLSSSIRFGAHAEPREAKIDVSGDRDGEKDLLTWTSGWRKQKFTAWASQQRCKAQHQ
ncbi:hypothetical protein EJ02DRAFT_147173 [Clathrospora elynae]|uniref:Fringe-like glycosyltransferase domain-containing protein n=1 Tax=Clathrospora elynae TaxID=706981 RepID=A0A6A5S4S7_9PLEO|nr:hypothetical protein EJ02DRAFT_147173 [Clathrospora elynae]